MHDSLLLYIFIEKDAVVWTMTCFDSLTPVARACVRAKGEKEPARHITVTEAEQGLRMTVIPPAFFNGDGRNPSARDGRTGDVIGLWIPPCPIFKQTGRNDAMWVMRASCTLSRNCLQMNCTILATEGMPLASNTKDIMGDSVYTQRMLTLPMSHLAGSVMGVG